jgi:hypothetical protein
VATAKPATAEAPPAEAGPPAAAVRALTYAIQGLGRHLGVGSKRDSAATVVHLLGASLSDAQALAEYLNRAGEG